MTELTHSRIDVSPKHVSNALATAIAYDVVILVEINEARDPLRLYIVVSYKRIWIVFMFDTDSQTILDLGHLAYYRLYPSNWE